MRKGTLRVFIALIGTAVVSISLISTSSADPADNTPGGAQVGSLGSTIPSYPFPTGSTNVTTADAGNGLTSYTVTRADDSEPTLVATGTRSFRANTWLGDVIGIETADNTSRRVRLWDVSAKPAVPILDETFGCTDGEPSVQTSPNLRYVAFMLQCTVPGSGGTDIQRFYRIYDLGAQPTTPELVYSNTISNVAINFFYAWSQSGVWPSDNDSNQVLTPAWSNDFDELVVRWGTADAGYPRYADVVDLQARTHHAWQTGIISAGNSTGTGELALGFTPCGSSFVTTAEQLTNGATSEQRYLLRSTGTGAVLGQVVTPWNDQIGVYASMDEFRIDAAGVVTGRQNMPGQPRVTIGTDQTPCDATAPSPVPAWPAGSTSQHPLTGGRTLSWPLLATDDHAVTGYEIVTDVPNWHTIMRVTGGDTTSAVLPSDVPATEASFRVYALDAAGRRSAALNGGYYCLYGAPGAVPTAPTPTPTPTRTPPKASTPVLPSTWIKRWPARSGSHRAKVGKTVVVTAPTYSTTGKAHHIRASYRWYVSGKAAKGQTARKLKIKKSWRGKTITVRVTISAPGYTTRAKSLSFGKARK